MDERVEGFTEHLLLVVGGRTGQSGSGEFAGLGWGGSIRVALRRSHGHLTSGHAARKPLRDSNG